MVGAPAMSFLKIKKSYAQPFGALLKVCAGLFADAVQRCSFPKVSVSHRNFMSLDRHWRNQQAVIRVLFPQPSFFQRPYAGFASQRAAGVLSAVLPQSSEAVQHALQENAVRIMHQLLKVCVHTCS